MNQRMSLYSRFITTIFGAIIIFSAHYSCQATTKGLNQIVTPDVQPLGQLSLSVQQQDPTIGNRDEFQVELGVAKNFEIAAFQGTSPSEQIFNAEYGLYAKGPYLLSTGFLNWSTKGTAPQPYLEGGYYTGPYEFIAGAVQVVSEDQGTGGSIRNSHQTQAVFGTAYHASQKLLFQLDYQGGSGNFSTAGFTYSITPSVSLNPALYISNASLTKCYGYAVLTWNIQAFGGQNQPQTTSQAQPQKKSAPVAGSSSSNGNT